MMEKPTTAPFHHSFQRAAFLFALKADNEKKGEGSARIELCSAPPPPPFF